MWTVVFKRVKRETCIQYVLCVCKLFYALLMLQHSLDLTDAADSLSKFGLRPLIVISLDGFRHDYLDKFRAPNIKWLKENGSFVPIIKTSFPTITPVNHFAIATGKFPEKTGTVGDNLYDPKLKRRVQKTDMAYYMFNKRVKPIWTANELAGRNRYSSVVRWPGSTWPYANHKIKNVLSSGGRNLNYRTRVDTAIKWLTDKTKPSNLVMLYFEEPDLTGHKFSPNNKGQMQKAISKVDDAVGYLKTRLKQVGLLNKANLIITSDHGMTEIRPQWKTDLVKILQKAGISKSSYQISSKSPVLQISQKGGNENKIYSALKAAAKTNHYRVYRKKDIPKRWHVKRSSRMMQFLVVADEHWVFQDKKFRRGRNGPTLRAGTHGYDNNLPSMWSMLIAHGPSFKSKFRAKVDRKNPRISNRDIYPLMAHLLNIRAPASDGKLQPFKQILRNGKGVGNRKRNVPKKGKGEGKKKGKGKGKKKRRNGMRRGFQSFPAFAFPAQMTFQG